MSAQKQEKKNRPPLKKGPPRVPDPLPGTRFGRWLVTGPAPDRRYECPKQPVVHRMVHCRCDCGAERDVALFRLLQGATKSCGSCGFARPGRRVALKPGDTATRDPGRGPTNRPTVWLYIRELASVHSGKRDHRVLLCRCQRGHEVPMYMTTFRGDPTRLPLCRQCVRDRQAFTREMTRGQPRSFA